MSKPAIRTGLALVVLLAVAACTSLQARTFSDESGAIRGYDPVAYHTEGKPVKGESRYTHSYNGAEWRFSSEENQRLFASNPERYAPQYGGFCAYGMSKGFVVQTDPNAWTIVDNKLFLNYSTGVRKTWLKDTDGNIAKADGHWLEKQQSAVFE